MRAAGKVKLIDGPYEGISISMHNVGRGLYVYGDLPDGTEITGRDAYYAYYRPTRKRTEYRFKGWIGEEELIEILVRGRS